MPDNAALLAHELQLREDHVRSALALLAEGGTVPFIARYRKERTGEMNEVVLRELFERFAYLTELDDRKQVILSSIAEQGKLTEELKAAIGGCRVKTELEDLYLPYRPKKRTRATIAREKGLESLADFIRGLNRPDAPPAGLREEAQRFVSVTAGVASPEEALQGASDILAEETAETARLRAHIRQVLLDEGVFVSAIGDEHPAGTTKFEMYRSFRAPVKEIHPHTVLALRRGEAAKIIRVTLEFSRASVLAYIEAETLRTPHAAVREFLSAMIADAFDRLMEATLVADVRLEKKLHADLESIRTFEANLRDLLLSSPAGMKPTLGIDPGFRTGCKVVAISATGQLLANQTVFPHMSDDARVKAGETIRTMIAHHGIELIAIGNGTAGRETEEFIAGVLDGMEHAPLKVMVNESGASVYSASKVAIEEFPDHDITVRGAVSIARRLQDPLAELVKIDPRSIGVGQYQHDVDQKLLRKKLDDTVESCVNYVGVDLNTASRELLSYVSGINRSLAKNIVTHRHDHGPFRSREALSEVPKFGPKAFEQAAGFLRIRESENPLDNTAVHPERYGVVEAIAADLGVPLREITHAHDRLDRLPLHKYVTAEVGEPTLRDILAELKKPGRDPRATFTYARFREGVKDIKDLSPGMALEGVVTNVANFGAFVDIGVHQDGLVHISQLADKFVNDPKTIVKVGQIVHVHVLEVNTSLKRISLSMKSSAPKAKGGERKQHPKKQAPHYSLDDLKAKFNTRR